MVAAPRLPQNLFTVNPRLAEPRLGLNYTRCFAAWLAAWALTFRRYAANLRTSGQRYLNINPIGTKEPNDENFFDTQNSPRPNPDIVFNIFEYHGLGR